MKNFFFFLVSVCPMQYLGHTDTKKLFVSYQKFRFNWASCILTGNPTLEWDVLVQM